MERPLYPDDIVAKLSNPSHIGVVERTHEDVDGHEPSPQRNEDSLIKHDKDITHAAFRKFLKDGVPPKNTIFVRWQHTPHAWLTQTSKLALLDRSLLIGDVVKRNVRDASSGVIINTFTSCMLQPVPEVTYKDKHHLRGLLPPGPLEAGFERPTSPPPLLRDVPALELQPASSPSEDDLVIFKDWIGRVVAVVNHVVLKLADNCVVELADDVCEHADGALEAFEIGDIAVTTKGKVRTGKWVFGQYTPNTPPVGTVVDVRIIALDVVWLQRRIGSTNDAEPPATLEREELESEAFKVYDRTRRPKPSSNGEGSYSTLSNSEIDARLGLRVRFKDLAGACVKYDGSNANGKLSRIDRSNTLGYDLNVYDIVSFTTEVTVQWQDLTMSTEKSIDLIPDSSIDDEHAVWPAEIAHTLDNAPVANMPTVEQPSKVGVIQSVNAEERMAKIRWAPSAVVQYSVDTEEDTGVRSLLTGAVGMADGTIDEVSLYDVEAPGAMNVRRGDMVLIAQKTWLASAGQQGTSGVDWLGEVVDTCLDGTLIVRLGASDEVCDVKMCREYVVVAVRSDDTDVAAEWADSGADDTLEDMLNINPEYEDEGYEDSWDDEDDDLDSDESEEELQATYEDEHGQPLSEDEVENGDWESDDADEDMKMIDAHDGQTPPTSTSATPPETSKRKREVDETDTETTPSEPSSYLVLDDAVPSSQHYANTPSSFNATHMKRVQKEHRILQKPEAIPKGVYVRTWESRLDLIRALFIGPTDTPYCDAPFVVDFHLPPDFPTAPPHAFFHSWPGESGLGGVGRVNPNLYEDGKICLSLLGTWEGSKGEGWNASRSTLLQVIVSLLGLVLVKEPYFNEAGYEHLAGLESSQRPSALYTERTFLRARTFAITALSRLQQAPAEGTARDLEGVESALKWQYWAEDGPRLAVKLTKEVEEVLKRSEAGDAEPDGLTVMSKGACIPLRRVLERLRQLQ